jgi:hypothetical protein
VSESGGEEEPVKQWEARYTVLAVGAVAVLVLMAGYAIVTGTRNADGVAVANEGGSEAAVTDDVGKEEAAVAEASPTAPATRDEELEVTSEPENVESEDDRPSRLRNATRSWNTNWSKRTIEYDELLSGGPPRDGIPSIDDPLFIRPDEAARWLADNEPVIALEIGGDARAYPLQILTWHEIVNDVVGDVPVTVTFCPLCNSAITFDRRLGGEVYEFGTSGLLRNSDLVMYDRTTESLWQQLTGEAIVGDLVGQRLTFLPSSLVSFEDFRGAYPEGIVLSRDTGYSRDYGRNPYAGYDTIGRSPFLFTGPEDGRLPAVERVVTVALENAAVAYPLSVLSELGVIHDTQDGRDLVVFHTAGTSSALGAGAIAQGEDVGATGVFDPNLDGQLLTFDADGGSIVDEQTGSTWNVLGQAVEGPLAGSSLEPIVHGDHFWFAWAAFKPDTIVYEAE